MLQLEARAQILDNIYVQIHLKVEHGAVCPRWQAAEIYSALRTQTCFLPTWLSSSALQELCALFCCFFSDNGVLPSCTFCLYKTAFPQSSTWTWWRQWRQASVKKGPDISMGTQNQRSLFLAIPACLPSRHQLSSTSPVSNAVIISFAEGKQSDPFAEICGLIFVWNPDEDGNLDLFLRMQYLDILGQLSWNTGVGTRRLHSVKSKTFGTWFSFFIYYILQKLRC